MNAYDKLVKEIDVLTYNARSVINALIRSTVKSGSSDGYKVTRAGVEITLTRIDIYRLYKFYSAWEYVNYNVDTFDTILSEQDSLSVTYSEYGNNGTVDSVTITTPTTKSLVKHSQILYMNSTNSSKTDSTYDSYWIDLIQNALDPKLISNSAPIPLNLRTPIYDENLSTKTFSQYETYLFPFGYSQISLLGYSGDTVDHQLGGNSWTFTIDDYLNINTPKVSIGGIDTTDTFKSTYSRNGSLTSPYNMVWGYNTYGLAKYSTVGGNSSFITPSSTSGVSIGNTLLISGLCSSSIGGSLNVVDSKYGSTIGGYNLTVSGNYGFSTNKDNVVGGFPYKFKLSKVVTSSSSCITITKSSDCEVSEDSTSTVGYNVINISASDNTEFMTEKNFQIKVGDRVAIYNKTRSSSTTSYLKFYEKNGFSYDTQYSTIISVTYNSDKSFSIQLSNDLYGDNIDGGYISFFSRTGLTAGIASTALNLSTIAFGSYQTVVGAYNDIVSDALFIVGNGSSLYSDSSVNYIESDYINSVSYISNRSNCFVVRPFEVYACATDYIWSGISSDGYATNKMGLVGAYAYSYDPSYETYSVIRSYYTNSYFLNDNAGVLLYNKTYGNSPLTNATVFLTDDTGGIIISSGYIVDTSSLAYNIFSSFTKKSIGIVAENDLNLYSLGAAINISAESSYINMDFKNLALTGNTWGALTATDDQRAFDITRFGYIGYEKYTTYSGFMHRFKKQTPMSELIYLDSKWQDTEDSFILSSSYINIGIDDLNENNLVMTGLHLPGCNKDYSLFTENNIPRPIISITRKDTTSTTNNASTIYKALAYYDDLQNKITAYNAVLNGFINTPNITFTTHYAPTTTLGTWVLTSNTYDLPCTLATDDYTSNGYYGNGYMFTNPEREDASTLVVPNLITDFYVGVNLTNCLIQFKFILNPYNPVTQVQNSVVYINNVDAFSDTDLYVTDRIPSRYFSGLRFNISLPNIVPQYYSSIKYSIANGSPIDLTKTTEIKSQLLNGIVMWTGNIGAYANAVYTGTDNIWQISIDSSSPLTNQTEYTVILNGEVNYAG